MKLYLATGNAHKVEEFGQLLAAAELPVTLLSATSVGGMPEVDETATTFAGNARIKAEALRALVPHDSWVLADDSGLEVDALGGAPGIRSARYAGEKASDGDNRQKLLAEMKHVPESQRRARFVCVLALLGPHESHLFEGTCSGRMIESESGAGGFGYDPLFRPDGFEATFAEMPGDLKNRISHRGRALEKLAAWLRTCCA